MATIWSTYSRTASLMQLQTPLGWSHLSPPSLKPPRVLSTFFYLCRMSLPNALFTNALFPNALFMALSSFQYQQRGNTENCELRMNVV